MFFIRVQAFRDPLRGEVPHVQILMNDGPNALTWHAQLLSYWFNQNPEVFKNKLVNLINNFVVVSVLGSPGRGVTQVEKSPRLMWATQISTATYCGVCSFCVLSEWRGFLSTCYLAGKKKPCWQLALPFCWNRSSRQTCLLSDSVTRKDLQFGTWTHTSFHRQYRFRPTASRSKSGWGLSSKPSYFKFSHWTKNKNDMCQNVTVKTIKRFY